MLQSGLQLFCLGMILMESLEKCNCLALELLGVGGGNDVAARIQCVGVSLVGTLASRRHICPSWDFHIYQDLEMASR